MVRVIELETLEAFDTYLDTHNSLADTASQGLDLRERTWRPVSYTHLTLPTTPYV